MHNSLENEMRQAKSVQGESKAKKSIPWPKLEFKQWQVLKKNKKLCLLLAASVTCVIIIGMLVAFPVSGGRPSDKGNSAKAASTLPTQNITQTPQNPIHHQLNDISVKLANIEQRLSSKHSYVDVGQIRQSLASLQSQVNQLAAQSNAMITQAIKASTDQLKDQLTTIKKQLQVITSAKEHHKMLKASHLPFTVLSIDNIQQSEVVTVNFYHKVVPLDIGESIAGWTLATASDVNQKAEFKNANDDYVLINLNAISPRSKGDQ